MVTLARRRRRRRRRTLERVVARAFHLSRTPRGPGRVVVVVRCGVV
jgi:hypothetical protein